MRFLQSAEQKQMERKLVIQKARMTLEKYVHNCKKDIAGYVETAGKAKEIGNTGQLDIARKAVAKCMAEQKVAETQLLNIRLAVGMQSRVESQQTFFTAMKEMARYCTSSFKDLNIAGLQKELSTAAMNAEHMNQQMEIFLDSSVDMLAGGAISSEIAEEALTDEAFERLIDESKIKKKRKDTISVELAELDKLISQNGGGKYYHV